jgi:hypothetical protein
MSRKLSSGLNLTIDGLGVLASVAEAIPVLGAPVKSSVEALKQILQYARVSVLTVLCHMILSDYDLQEVKNNKEDMLALATYAQEVTSKLFDGLKRLEDVDSMSSDINDFVKYVLCYSLINLAFTYCLCKGNLWTSSTSLRNGQISRNGREC